LCPTTVQRGAQRIAVEGFIGHQGIEFYALDQRLDADAVMTLTRQQDKAHQIAKGIDEGEDFGAQAATGTIDGLRVYAPPGTGAVLMNPLSTPEPFRWVKSADDILAAIERFCTYNTSPS